MITEKQKQNKNFKRVNFETHIAKKLVINKLRLTMLQQS